ncbi:MAG: D-amino acid dehydrogenase [Ramlibacter sp.]
MRVCVLGAGVVGLAAAYELRRAGHEITVVDAAADVGAGASGGNGGQLSYSYVQPLADPSIWLQLPHLLLSRASPLKIRPALDARQWQWACRFLLACNAAQSTATTAKLLALAAASRAQFDLMREREGLDGDFSATGKLVLSRTEAAFAVARRQMALQRALGGAPQQAVSKNEAIAIEPALAQADVPIAGAIFTPSECAADCQKVCVALAKALRDQGVRFRLGAAVNGFAQRGARVLAARTDAGDIVADRFVMALGAASAPLARQVGVRLPLYPLKGYSITVPIERASGAPRVNITDSARKVVFARIGDRLRIAGMAELVGDDASIPVARIESLKESLRSLFPGCGDPRELQSWTGMRPATPTGEPVVGLHRDGPANLVFNTGHGALGFTLAFGTALQVTNLLAAA